MAVVDMTIDPRIPTMPGWRTSGFQHPGSVGRGGGVDVGVGGVGVGGVGVGGLGLMGRRLQWTHGAF